VAVSAPLAVVIPTRNEAGRLPLLLADLARAPQLIAECVVVDGGSSDGTAHLASRLGARVLHSSPSRGEQLLRGIAATTAPWLWLLHADGRLSPDWPDRITAVLAASSHGQPQAWYGELRVDCPGLPFRVLERLVSLRSALGQRPYGDQSLLLARRSYLACGGLSPLPLMEDLEFAERFASQGRFRSLGLTLTVDGRRWRRLGLLGTTASNLALRRAWRRGVPAERLAQRYRR
jgi:rSAM/selenodomain-associated transferase 2